MYTLTVHYPDAPVPTDSRAALTASEVLKLIPEVLAAHPECERVVVSVAGTRLFAVDRKGNRVGD